MGDAFSWERFDDLPVVGILRGFACDHAAEIGAACRDGGLSCIEVTMNSPDAPAQIETLRRACDGMNVGAGTVRSLKELHVALDAGACFIVTPIVVPDVIAACRERGVPVLPGAYTPTEIHACLAAGADLVKVFPAETLGPAYIRAVRGPLDGARLLATGGVTPENAAAYRAAGAAGVGVGSPLFAHDRMEARDWPWLQAQIDAFRAAWHEKA